MKHTTRMQRHEEKIRAVVKRNKKIITFTTLVGLICPATLGTIQALADETAPTTEQTAEPVAEPVAETQPTETITPEQTTTDTLSQETETAEPVENVTTEPEQPVTTEETQPVVSTETVQAQAPVNNVEQAQAITPLSDSGVVAEYRAKLANYQAQASQLVADGATADQMTTINALLSAFEININNYENDIGDMPAVWLADIDSGIIPTLETEIQTVSDQLSQPDLSALHAKWQEYMTAIQALLDELENKVTGTSYQARYTALWNRWDTASITGSMFPENVRDQAFYDIWLPELASILADLQQLKSEIDAPPVQTGVFYDLVGDTSAKVGETKTYQYNEVKFFSDGTMTETIVNIADTSYPLTSSNPSDVIVGGSITFGSEGTRTLVAKDNAGASLVVNVTKDSQEKTLTDIGLIPVIGMSVDGKLVPWSDFRVNLYYSDNTEEAVIPNATDYVFTTDNPNDVVTADGIIFNGEGSRVITVAHKGFTAKNGFVVAKDQGLKEDDLKEAIKNGDDKISQGGWETTKDLEEAIQKGKDVLVDDNRTQEDIDNATKQINDAIDALTKKDDNGNGGNDNNGNGGNNNGNNGNGNNGNSGSNGSNNQNGNNNGSNSNNGANGGDTGNNSNKTNTTNLNNQSNQTSNANNSNKDNLPLTGDSTTNGLLAGLSLVGLSLVALIKRRRKA